MVKRAGSLSMGVGQTGVMFWQRRRNGVHHCAAAATSAETTPSSGVPTALSEHIGQNIESIVALQRREWGQTSTSQRRVERVSRFVGRPAYLLVILGVALLWILFNIAAPVAGWWSFDPVPCSILQGLLTLIALLTTTIVLIAQNRQSKLEQQHVHLDLQVNLLTEQKVSKLILLIEELRRDLPMVKDRHDPKAEAMQEAADTARVIEAIQEVGLTGARHHDGLAQVISEPADPGAR
jgi:uncharacterized membrane protein